VPAVQLSDGDVVFRRGDSFVSQIVLSADPTGQYSHVGIVITRDGVPLVVHASPAESSDTPSVTIAEPFPSFVAPEKASVYAVYRTRNVSKAIAKEAALRAAAYVRAATPFDSAFDLDSPNRVYCTELVWRSYAEAGLDLAVSGRYRLKLPLFDKEVLVPSSISASRHLEPIAKFNSTQGEAK
jgi:hypothetical protein